MAAKAVYRPPGARGAPSTFRVHDDVPAPVVVEKELSKSALKNKKKREAKKAQVTFPHGA